MTQTYRILRQRTQSLATPLVALLALAALALAVAGCAELPVQAEQAAPFFSGFIEGTEVTVAPQVDGRIIEIGADLGDTVRRGDVVVRLDDAVLQSRRAEAEAGLAAAQANRDRTVAGAHAETIAAAEGALAEALARYEGARTAHLNARTAITEPQSLNAEITDTHTQLALAEQAVERAEAELAATELKAGIYADRGGDVERTWALQTEAARAALAQAKAQQQGAAAYLNALLAMRRNPLPQQAELHRAEGEAAVAAAQVEAARAKLAELRAGPTEASVAMAEAQVQQAAAAVAQIDVLLDQRTLTAPISGIVSTRSAHAGEVAVAGRPLLTITDLATVTLIIYVPADQVGTIVPGQTVAVTVDAYPDRTFSGAVVSIASEAEFTPRDVQTSAVNVSLVFAVKVTIANPDRALKPGMPADAILLAP
jgi:HlyD family secretion protein